MIPYIPLRKHTGQPLYAIFSLLYEIICQQNFIILYNKAKTCKIEIIKKKMMRNRTFVNVQDLNFQLDECRKFPRSILKN